MDWSDKKLSVLMSFSGHGGVERMMANLIKQMAKSVASIDLLLLRNKSPHLTDMPENVNLIKLKTKHSGLAVGEIAAYLKKEQPEAMLVAKDRAGRAALKARKKAKVNTRICIRLGTNLSAALERKSALNQWLRRAPMRKLYALVDKVIAVSEGVRQDTLAITGIKDEQSCVIRNPVITADFREALMLTAPHDWLADPEVKVVMGAGRLSEQKDFATLINAFALVREKMPVKLIILGEGALRGALEEQVRQLGLENDVAMPGFQADIYRWLGKADLFVLSSRWEGSPNVLTEALSLGVPCVSTRCPSGPNEVLQEGKYGPLVSMGNAEEMADAMFTTITQPLPKEVLMESTEEYNVETSANRYLSVLFGEQ